MFLVEKIIDKNKVENILKMIEQGKMDLEYPGLQLNELNYYEMVYLAENYGMGLPISVREILSNKINTWASIIKEIEQAYETGNITECVMSISPFASRIIIPTFELVNEKAILTDMGKDLLKATNELFKRNSERLTLEKMAKEKGYENYEQLFRNPMTPDDVNPKKR